MFLANDIIHDKESIFVLPTALQNVMELGPQSNNDHLLSEVSYQRVLYIVKQCEE